MLPRILVIDDEEGVLDMVRGHFEPRGFEVHTANDGHAGIELCKQMQPEVILVDLKMKKMDGDRAVPELRQRLPRAKIYIISAYPEEVLKRRIENLDVDAYFEKPISLLDIERLIRNAVNSK